MRSEIISNIGESLETKYNKSESVTFRVTVYKLLFTFKLLRTIPNWKWRESLLMKIFVCTSLSLSHSLLAVYESHYYIFYSPLCSEFSKHSALNLSSMRWNNLTKDSIISPNQSWINRISALYAIYVASLCAMNRKLFLPHSVRKKKRCIKKGVQNLARKEWGRVRER